MIKAVATKTDYVGALASFLCLLHCAATPFIFVAKVCTNSCCEHTPLWWRLIDYIFLIVSLFAVRYAVRAITKNWIKIGLWTTWTLLLMIVINESIPVVDLPRSSVYYPSFGLIALHLYNQWICKCSSNICCSIEHEK